MRALFSGIPDMDEQLRKAALEYHRTPVPGKIAIVPTKGLINQRDLALAYTPGAAACEAIAADPAEARSLTARGNLVVGITIGPILLGAARPVHILTPSATVRRIVNMTALAVADANAPRGQEQTLF